jgi:hypothetical protein
MENNTVVTGAQSAHTDAPRLQRVRVAHTTVKRKEVVPVKNGVKGVLPKAPRPGHSKEDTEDKVLVVSSPDSPSTSTAGVSNSTQTPPQSRPINAGIEMKALNPHPEVTPEDELVKIWSLPKVEDTGQKCAAASWEVDAFAGGVSSGARWSSPTTSWFQSGPVSGSG